MPNKRHPHSHGSVSQCVNKGSVPQLLHIFLCLLKASLWWLWGRRRTFHQLHKVVAPGDFHHAKHALAVAPQPLHVAAPARLRLRCREKERGEKMIQSATNCYSCNKTPVLPGYFFMAASRKLILLQILPSIFLLLRLADRCYRGTRELH